MAAHLIDLVERLPVCPVVLVGDLMLDKYVFGRTDRVSPEAPIPVLRFTHEEHRLGGAGFVAAALAALGAIVRPVGVVGDDEAGREVVKKLTAGGGASAPGLIVAPGRPTVTKIRLLGSSQDRTPQQMIRLDIEETGPVDDALAARVVAAVEAALDEAAGAGAARPLLCLEDYNKGVLAPAVCRKLIESAKRRGVAVLVDPASLSDYSKYRAATCLKLNRPEAAKVTGVALADAAGVRAAAERLLADLELEAVVITLNDGGAYLATRDGGREMLTSRPRAVADATGAGDMVLATLCVARAAGASWHDAVALGNVAAGIEVERLGCVPVTRDEIVADLLREHRAAAGKERPLDALLAELRGHRAAGKRIVFTNGCFDLVHLGHVKYFQFAKAQGDVLVVGVNTDAGIRRLKGDKRPIVNESDRVGVLAELESIDYLVRFDQDTPIDLIRAIGPDVLVKGADYRKEQVVGWDYVESRGGTVALAPLIDGKSTSSVIQRVLEAYGR